MTGSKFERKGLEQLLAFARSGDTVIVWKLDLLGRSLKDLIETLNLLKDRGIDFISLTEHIDTTTLAENSSSIAFPVQPCIALSERRRRRQTGPNNYTEISRRILGFTLTGRDTEGIAVERAQEDFTRGTVSHPRNGIRRPAGSRRRSGWRRLSKRPGFCHRWRSGGC